MTCLSNAESDTTSLTCLPQGGRQLCASGSQLDRFLIGITVFKPPLYISSSKVDRFGFNHHSCPWEVICPLITQLSNVYMYLIASCSSLFKVSASLICSSLWINLAILACCFQPTLWQHIPCFPHKDTETLSLDPWMFDKL